MRVIADNTPLRYLILLGYVDILPALYGRVIIPPAVVTELQHSKTSAVVRAWMAHLPAWVEIRQTTTRAYAALALLASCPSAMEQSTCYGVATVFR
jgi:predicted nucleic acid-binding protein